MENYQQIMAVYCNPSSRKMASSLIKTIEVDPSCVATILITIFDCLVDKVPEAYQTLFEQQTLAYFNAWVLERHNTVFKEMVDNYE